MTLPETSPDHLFAPDGHPPLEQLRQYHEDTLPPAARHPVEKHLLACELCTDVLAGIATTSRLQTQVAVIDLKHQIQKRVQSPSKNRSFNVPFLRVAAAILILLVSGGIFKFWQQTTRAPESTAVSSPESQPEPMAAVPVLPDPIVKPAEPEPTTKTTGSRQQPSRNKAWPKVQDEATEATALVPEDDLFPVDTAVILDAIAAPTAATPNLAKAKSSGEPQNIPQPVETKRVAAAAASKQMGIVVQGNSTFTGQTVAGKVLDGVSNQGLPGAMVTVKGTTLTTTTDADGNFSLAVPTGKDELVFSIIGYTTQEQKITSRENQLAVRLNVDAKQLSEVVVTGYGKAENIPLEIIRAKPQAGQKAYHRYIRDNLRYPAEAREQKLDGKVEVGFTVTAAGELTDFKILKSLNPACDAEAIRVIKEGPAWMSARLQNQPQPENVRVTVRFKLK